MKAISASALDRGRPVLVTGGCGFIGSNIANALAEAGQDVLVLDNLSRRGTEDNAAWLKALHGGRIKIVNADIRDNGSVRRLVTEASAVMHLAAQVAVTTSLEDPRTDFAVNAAGTLNLLECVRRFNPGAPVLFASTNKVYGKLLPEDAAIRQGRRYAISEDRFRSGVSEHAQLDLYSPYGCSKGAADQYVHDFGRVFGLRTVVFRMSCIYGPRQFGNEDQGWIAHFLLRAIRGDKITIYGNGYQVRDALFVDDAVAAWLGALNRIDTVAGCVFNLGGGPANSISLLELIDLIAELQGGAPRVGFDAWRPGDQPWYVSDIRAVSAALDWSPCMPLRDGLRALNAWLSTRFASPEIILQEAQA